jgi:hypothetical protein
LSSEGSGSKWWELRTGWVVEQKLVILGNESNHSNMTERELRKLEAVIRSKMDDIKKQKVSLKDSGLGGLMNTLKKVDEALYEKIMPEYKEMVKSYNIFK